MLRFRNQLAPNENAVENGNYLGIQLKAASLMAQNIWAISECRCEGGSAFHLNADQNIATSPSAGPGIMDSTL